MDNEIYAQRFIPKVSLIGQVLLKKQLISEEQLRESLAEQKKVGGLLGDILIQKGFVSEDKMCQALASQSDLCYIPLEKYKVSKDILKLMPVELAVKYCCLPLDKIGDVLTISMADPFNQQTISMMETVIHCKIVSVIGAKTQIEKMIKLYYQI